MTLIRLQVDDRWITVSSAPLGTAEGPRPASPEQVVHVIGGMLPGALIMAEYCDSRNGQMTQGSAVIGLSNEEALELGRRSGQNVVYAWSDTYLSVFSCADGGCSVSGWRSEKMPNGHAAVAEPTTSETKDSNHRGAAEIIADLGESSPTLVTAVIKADHLSMIPLSIAEWQASRQAELKMARTYGEVRAAEWQQVDNIENHPNLLDYYTELYESKNPDADLKHLTEDELRELVLPDDDEPFNLDGHPAFDTSVSEWADSNEPDIDVDTDQWMPREVACRFGEGNAGYVAMPTREWEEAEFVYPAVRREEIESALRDLGFTIRRDDALIWAYLGS